MQIGLVLGRHEEESLQIGDRSTSTLFGHDQSSLIAQYGAIILRGLIMGLNLSFLACLGLRFMINITKRIGFLVIIYTSIYSFE